MAYHIQSSFSAGELDPALHERTTFDKFKSGCATVRNTIIGKTGRLISRGGLAFDIQVKYDDKECVIYSPPFTSYMIEWGHEYVRIHNVDLGIYVEDSHDFTEDDLPYVRFVPSGAYVYIFCKNQYTQKMVLGDLDPGDPFLATRFLGYNQAWGIPVYPLIENSRTITGTGYSVRYAMSLVRDGQESIVTELSVGTGKLPINAGEKNTFVMDTSVEPNATEMRVYRKPFDGNSYGYIGSTVVNSGTMTATYVDIGEAADYTHSPISEIADFISLGAGPGSRCGTIYQQRLLLLHRSNDEVIIASRTGYQNNFTRDYPYGSDSALAFKAGTEGKASVLHMADYDGLMAFTTRGIYQNSGALTPDNLALVKKANYIIDERIPPLEIPGALLFVDKSTNTIRSLVYSNEAGGFPGEEISIFSNHLFMNKSVKSWAFQDGDIPLVWVVMDDGSLVALTYNREHQMQAWSRHDTDGLFEAVTVVKSLSAKSTVYFVIKRGGKRFIEKGTDRFAEDIKDLCLMDCSTTFKSVLSLTAVINVNPVTPGDWAGELIISSDTDIFANTADNGAVDSVFRFFDSDGSAVDLTVSTYTDAKHVRVLPDCEFPGNESTEVTLYKTFQTLTGLSHLNGKRISVMVDGYVVASPNNDLEDYPYLVVVGGELTLPDDMRGAIIHVGLPFTADTETLDIDTVEQKPTLLESRIINKLYLKIYNTRGLFIGSEFPANDKVSGMQDVEERTEDIEFGIIGNAAQKPQTKRLEVAIPNDWKSAGRVCLRQVDPLPFEILSIIPDLTVIY